MTTRTTLNISLEMLDVYDTVEEEEIVRCSMRLLAPLLVRDSGFDKGSLSLNEGRVILSWDYQEQYDEYNA